MEPLLVQQFLLRNSLSDLKKEYGIKSSAKPGDLFFSLDYSQFESVPSEIVNQCRGLILGVDKPLREEHLKDCPIGPTKVLARPFNRFFNYGEPHAENIEILSPDTLIFEKLDGTCCIVWWNPYLKEWCVATRRVPLSDMKITGFDDFTFYTLFQKALLETLGLKQDQPSDVFHTWTQKNLSKENTYIFELTTPVNRVLVDYTDFKVHLLGIRNTLTGQEYRIDTFKEKTFYGVPTCPVYQFYSLEEVIQFANLKNPLEQEGIVVCDSSFKRIKIKNIHYIKYSAVVASFSERNVLRLILSNQIDDVIPMLAPYFKEHVFRLKDSLLKLISKNDTIYDEIQNQIKESQNKRKDFAIKVNQEKGFMHYLIERFKLKASSFEDFVQSKKNDKNYLEDKFIDSVLYEIRKLESR